MTPKQEAFCREYAVDMNASQAAIRAGYSVKTAGSIGQRLLKNVEIQSSLAEIKSQQTKRTDITADRVLSTLATIAFADPRRLLDADGYADPLKIPDDMAHAIAGIEPGQYGIKIKLNDRMKALELIGRHLAMFTDRSEVTHSVGQVLITLPDNGREAT